MAFEYNGVVYRDLEPQVRYDAEQVQLLKQADVTINESLQTINTELNGKLTKPANPSAESAVTMLADGTVGTKPLSEIGGKLYAHFITIKYSDGEIYVLVYSNNNIEYNITTFAEKYINVMMQASLAKGRPPIPVVLNITEDSLIIFVDGTSEAPIYFQSAVTGFTDAYTEL